jgi:hypothetical protein
MGNVQCKSLNGNKISFEMLENILKQGNSEIESRIKQDYLSIKNLNNINKCKASLEYKNIVDFIPIEKRKEQFTKWIKLIGISSLINLKNIKLELESILTKTYNNKKNKFNELILNGIPESIRSLIWITLSDKIPIKRDDNYFNELLQTKISKDLQEQIKKDIYRTYSNDDCTENHINQLKNILYAITLFNKEIGYCQGLNFIVGFILKITFFNTIDCFYLLTYILEEIKGYFIEDFPLLKLNNYIFNHFFIKLYPKLSEHFKNLEIPNELWIGKWMQTLFTLTLPFNELCRIWDCFFVNGFDFIIPISLSIIYYMEKKLLEFKDSSDVIYYFKQCFNPNKCEIIYNDFDKRILCIDKIIVRANKIFKSMNKEYIYNIKKEFNKKNNNLEKIEEKYCDLITKSFTSQSSTEFSTYKKISNNNYLRKNFGTNKSNYIILNEDEDDFEEENYYKSNKMILKTFFN